MEDKTYKEAKASVTYQLKTAGGFSTLFTMRGEDEEELLNRMALQEQYFLSNGFEPDVKRGFVKQDKPIEYVEGRTCPKCNAKLVYFEAKGLKHIKCSTAKYDWKTKTSSGCDFVEWTKDNQITATSNQTLAGGQATAAQKKLILDKWPELWQEGMSKAAAIEVIKLNFQK